MSHRLIGSEMGRRADEGANRCAGEDGAAQSCGASAHCGHSDSSNEADTDTDCPVNDQPLVGMTALWATRTPSG
ncbi:hypothetical protein OG242_18195 [Streptomyces sp. NBC_00727]|uniref:hypothetical protein n=1 Tax=Streptomyces sp. NBC_00727 TaxID=2903675 RepID=UPI00386B0B89